MKTKKTILFLIVITLIINCRREDDKLTEINNDGTGGISCLVNGNVLVSRGLPVGNPSEKFRVGNDEDIFYFVLRLHNRNPDTHIYKTLEIQVYDIDYRNPITLERLSLEGSVFQLGEYADPNLYGQFQTYGRYTDDNLENGEYNTTEIINGEISITSHDVENYVISGTFWFNAINENGERIEIREGKFDKIIQGL